MGTGFSKKKKEAKQMQEQMASLSRQLESTTVTGSAANGLVTITLSGSREMKGVKINPECVHLDDLEGLEVLIQAAYADALKQLEGKMQLPFF